ncbi:MAG: hypothetical protein R6V05_06605 [Candidatus Brocadiia bacterium]
MRFWTGYGLLAAALVVTALWNHGALREEAGELALARQELRQVRELTAGLQEPAESGQPGPKAAIGGAVHRAAARGGIPVRCVRNVKAEGPAPAGGLPAHRVGLSAVDAGQFVRFVYHLETEFGFSPRELDLSRQSARSRQWQGEVVLVRNP